jgi:predicted AlkP superfamily phosphohydrolase/phosphomutase
MSRRRPEGNGIMSFTSDVRPTRQLVIGLDAMEWSLVKGWAGEGKLPTFHRLMQEGVCGELETTSAQLPDTVWACTYTGVNPAKFEKFFYVQYDAATMGLRHVLDDAIRRPPFWEYLSRAGVRVGVVDVPKFPVSQTLNGFQLTNWGAHATKTSRASTPSSLIDEIQSRFGTHPVGDCDAVDDNLAALRGLRARVLDGVRLHGQMFRALMQERPWDVFFSAFSAPHCIGHHFWSFMDPTHPRHRPEAAAGLGDTIEVIYRAIDEEIGRMLALVGPDTRCLLVAAHGMGPIYHASWNLPEILEHLGYGRRRGDGAHGDSKPRAARVNPWRMLKMLVPGAWQYRIKAALPNALRDRLLFLWYTGGQQWSGCRAFAIPNNDSVGAIRVSLRGRDREGLVAPGDEYRRVCQDIAAALSELTDPVSGRLVVRKVTLTHEIFHGPYLEQLPDITVLWAQSFPWDTIHSPRFGTLRIRRQDSRSGSHTPRGFLLAAGPGVPAGVELTGHSIYDVAPTVLEAAGVPLPSDLDGKPLPLRRLAVSVP